MWKYRETDNEYISLHDCHATKISYEKGSLTCAFDGGFWIGQDHPANALGKNAYTNAGEVNFYLESENESDITIYVFEEKGKKTIREEWKLSELMECVNNGSHTLEFLYQYEGYRSKIIECWLWSDKKPYHRECELKLSLTQTEYCWNELCEEK